ncbi:MAG TPA: UDP-N-acetylmuramoyl-L-alanyl-D-glutamate--2,6-diaminopimelate ligase [Ktedonobacterales bacterium]|jgi:UDP-N-acetylmuramoyl-L-alanyl-D-glutamate--2,6-diaminopimelate ligase
MKLHQLLQGLPEPPIAVTGNQYDLDIAGIAYDSRKIALGWLFVAVHGTHTDGHHYISEALQRGAPTAVGEEPAPADLPPGALYVQVRDSRRDLAWLADTFYDHPSRKLGLIGITGTKGKSTTTNLIAEVFQRAGLKSGLMSTLNFRIGDHDWENETRQTTQESLENHAMLAEMVRQQVRYAVVETSSHGLALHRVTGIVYDVGIATNITSEHLEFHGTVEQYRRDKARLFEGLDPMTDKGLGAKKAAILNRDDASYDYLLPFCRVPILTYGIDHQADVHAVDLELSGAASRFRVVTPTGEIAIETPLIGRFNVYNCLATICAGYTQGISLEKMREALAHTSGIPGRMERIDCGQPFSVIVDYAHTPDSLEQVFRLLRPLTPGRLIAVFGSAGERNTQKRPKQGAISAQLADLTFLTDEDCREEDPEKILHEIAAGALEAGATIGKDLWLIVDRRQAIGAAFDAARPGDTVLLAGKGHEHSIIVGHESLPWDEREVARELLRERQASAGHP